MIVQNNNNDNNNSKKICSAVSAKLQFYIMFSKFVACFMFVDEVTLTMEASTYEKIVLFVLMLSNSSWKDVR